MSTRATVFVCVSCRRKIGEGENDFDHPGPALAERVRALLSDADDIDVVTVDCLAVCKRPCTVALAADGKWTYVVGDIDNVAHCDEVAAAARAFAASENGIVPWKERPATFRRGVISRIPPLGFTDWSSSNEPA
jgi:predicted metal-binding protein